MLIHQKIRQSWRGRSSSSTKIIEIRGTISRAVRFPRSSRGQKRRFPRFREPAVLKNENRARCVTRENLAARHLPGTLKETSSTSFSRVFTRIHISIYAQMSPFNDT